MKRTSWLRNRFEDPLTGEGARIPTFINVTVNGDSVIAEIPARNMALGKTARAYDEKDLLDFYITVVTDYITEESSSHFVVKTPMHFNELMKVLVPRMDETYNKLENIGFDFSLPGNIFGALDTIVVYTEKDAIDPPVFQNLLLKGESKSVGLMEFNRYSLSGFGVDRLAFAATRSIATLTALYYTKDVRVKTLWFDIAMADWLARKWHDTGVISLSIDDDPLIALKGIPVLTDITSQTVEKFFTESRRLSPLISYLDDLYNFTGAEQTLARIYKERIGGADLATSLKTVTNMEPSTWWPDFVEGYITGKVWDIDPAVFLKTSSQKGQVTLSEADTTHYFSGKFGDLAADIYTVTLNTSYAEKINSLRFTAESSGLQDEYLNVLLFGVRNNKPYYIGRGIDSIIADAGEVSDGNTFLAVVTSSLIEYPYRNDTPYTLTVTGEQDTSEFNQLIIQLPFVYRKYEWVDNDGFYSICRRRRRIFHMDPQYDRRGKKRGCLYRLESRYDEQRHMGTLYNDNYLYGHHHRFRGRRIYCQENGGLRNGYANDPDF